MSLTFYLMLLAALALSVVLMAALAIYWMRIARAICLNHGNKTGGDAHGNRSAD